MPPACYLKVGEKPTLLTTSRLAREQQLEDMIVADPRILSNEWMLIDGKRGRVWRMY